MFELARLLGVSVEGHEEEIHCVIRDLKEKEGSIKQKEF